MPPRYSSRVMTVASMMGSSICFDLGGIGEARGVIHFENFIARGGDAVTDAGRGGDEVNIELALEALLHDLEMQQTEKAAAKAEAERDGILGLETHGAVVQAEFFEGIAQQSVLVRFDWIETGKDHRLDGFESGEGLGRRVRRVGDGVAGAGFGNVLDVGVHESDFAGRKFLYGNGFGRLVAETFDLVLLPAGAELDLLAHRDDAVDYAGKDDDATIGVEPGVEDERAQGRGDIAARRRHAFHDGFERLVDAHALLGADEKSVTGVESDDFLDLGANALGLGGGQVDFINDGNNFEIMVEREVGIGEGLGLNALGGIDYEQCAFAGLQTAGNFIGEIDVAGRVDQVELIPVAVVGFVIEADGVGFDGDTALALEVHRVEHLGHHFALRESAGDFEKTIGQGAFAVVDVRNDGEIAYESGFH